MSDLLDRLEEREMPFKDVPICLKLNLLRERDEAIATVDRIYRQQKADQRMSGDAAALAAAKEAAAAVDEKIRAASITIRVTGVDRTTYNRFLLANPPRKGRQEPFNSATFFMHVAKVTGVYVDSAGGVHEMTAEEWEKIDSTITDGEHDRIASAVIEVNREVGATDIGFFAGSSVTTPASSETSE